MSFYLELKVTKYAENGSQLFMMLMRNILKLLNDNGLASIRDPMGISGLIPCSKTTAQKETALSRINTAATRAEKALSARQNDKMNDAFIGGIYYLTANFSKIDNINTKQNEQKQLERLAAQREIYSFAKRIYFLQICLTVIAPILLFIVSSIWDCVLTYSALFGVIVFILNRILLTQL